jgi:hypothetical protein
LLLLLPLKAQTKLAIESTIYTPTVANFSVWYREPRRKSDETISVT